MGVYINLVENMNGHSHIIKTGKYGIEGCELIFDESNHVGNGLFKVSGKEALNNYRKVLSEISERTNENSNKKYLDALVLSLSSLNLRENAVYSADFGEYFSYERDNKEYDPTCIITESKEHLEDALCGYCEFGNHKHPSDDRFTDMIKNIPEIINAFCNSYDKDRLIFSVHINYTNEDEKKLKRSCPSIDDYFIKSYNKRRLFYVLKRSGLDEFSMLDCETERFYVVVSREELQKWLVACQNKKLENNKSSLADKINIAEAKREPHKIDSENIVIEH